ncbi:MAG: C40 family peptidase [Dermatophilaceae bacterium]
MPNASKSARLRLVISAGAVLAMTAMTFGTPTLIAHADPVYPSADQVDAAKAAVGDKAAQVAAVEARLMASNARLVEVQTAAEVANEKYNLARILLQQRTDAAKAAGARADAASKAATIASDKLGQFAAATYMQGGNLGQIEAFLSSKGPQDLLDRAAGIALISDIRGRIMQDADASFVVAGVLRRQAAQAQAQQLAAAQAAESARAEAQAQVDSAAAETALIHTQQTTMISELATLRNTSVALERQRQDGLKAAAEARAAEQARAAAHARAAAASRAAARRQAAAAASAAAAAERRRQSAANAPDSAPVSQGPSDSGSGTVSYGPVPSRGGTASVIAFARAQIGDPYEWGAAGPGTWDCSGLTQLAWAQAGVYLSHYTGYQWDETRRVALSDLEPGDLVFFGDSGPTSHHVGLYVGNGQMIEAPHTGAVVTQSSIWRSDILPYGGRP